MFCENFMGGIILEADRNTMDNSLGRWVISLWLADGGNLKLGG
jgi:hypothetical protein